MSAAITVEALKAAKAIAVPVKEGVGKVGVQEIGRANSGGFLERLNVGGDVKSVLAAMETDPEVLGAEVRRAGRFPEVIDRVPLEDSKGEVRHDLSPQEAAHYENIGLRAHEVNGRECLVRDDINWEQRDAYGKTNKERAEQGLAPLDPNGRPYELHHVQQRKDGMLAELTRDEHRGAGADRMLHNPTKTSEIDRAEFDQFRIGYWRARVAEVQA